MGVMACGRKGCTNIMCNNYIYPSLGYLCDECMNEARILWSKEKVKFIAAFMETPKELPAENLDFLSDL